MGDALIIDVEGANQDGALVGWEYTATGMRFTIQGALAAALAAEREAKDARIKKLEKREAFMRRISPSVAAMLDEYDTPVAFQERFQLIGVIAREANIQEK